MQRDLEERGTPLSISLSLCLSLSPSLSLSLSLSVDLEERGDVEGHVVEDLVNRGHSSLHFAPSSTSIQACGPAQLPEGSLLPPFRTRELRPALRGDSNCALELEPF